MQSEPGCGRLWHIRNLTPEKRYRLPADLEDAEPCKNRACTATLAAREECRVQFDLLEHTYKRPPEELYELRTDPWAIRNLVNDDGYTTKESAMALTSRERVAQAIHFEQPDRVPFNFWMDRRRMDQYAARYGADFRITHFGADVVEHVLRIPFPTAVHEERSGTQWLIEEAFERWEDAVAMALPDPGDPEIFTGLAHALQTYPHHAILADLPNVLTAIEAMIRQERFYVDMLKHTDLVTAFFHRLSDIMAAVAERVCQMDVTALYVMDDIAYNNGLLMSPRHLREIVLPHWKKVIDVGHAYGKPIFFHTDGKIDELWELFSTELGVRMLNPMQPGLQSIGDFKRRYHGRAGVYGGLDTGRIHTMTPAQVRAHVFDLFEKAGAGGGLIMSTHDIDYTVPDETLEAMAAAIKECVYPR